MPARIVIVGGGFGGLEAAFSLKELLGPKADVTLVDRSAHHTFIPAIHEIISGKVSPRDIQVPFAAMLPPMGVIFVQDEVRALDRERRVVATDGHAIPYDFVILAGGAENNFFAVPGAEEHARRFRTADDAAGIRSGLDRLLESGLAKARIVLAGGGTEGVEVAGEVIDYLRSSGAEDDLHEGRVTVALVEGRSRLLPGFPEPARTAAQEILAGKGVMVLTGRHITEVGPDSVRLGPEDAFPFSLLVWSGGIRPAPLSAAVSLRKDRAGWIIVTSRLHAPDDPSVFAVGDAVSVRDEGESLPLQRLAYHAQDQAVIASINIAAAIAGKEPVDYVPRKKPQLISIGRDNGILVQDERVLTGGWVNSLKKAVEKRHIVACLTRPATARLVSVIPGRALFRRMRLRLPI